jgi:uncharacterized protein YciW
VRFWLAAQISNWLRDSVLRRYYEQRGKDVTVPNVTPALNAALAHARTLTLHPVSAQAADLQTLLNAGWSEDDIVTLSQLTAFISFQSRLLRGYRLLAGHEVDIPQPHAVTAGVAYAATDAYGQTGAGCLYPGGARLGAVDCGKSAA